MNIYFRFFVVVPFHRKQKILWKFLEILWHTVPFFPVLALQILVALASLSSGLCLFPLPGGLEGGADTLWLGPTSVAGSLKNPPMQKPQMNVELTLCVSLLLRLVLYSLLPSVWKQLLHWVCPMSELFTVWQ